MYIYILLLFNEYINLPPPPPPPPPPYISQPPDTFLYTSTWIAEKVIRLQTEGGGWRKGSYPTPRGG